MKLENLNEKGIEIGSRIKSIHGIKDDEIIVPTKDMIKKMRVILFLILIVIVKR